MMKYILGVLLCFVQLSGWSQISGCTDILARNYNPKATVNDGSCKYKRVAIQPESSLQLNDSLAETSGLVVHDGRLWTHNDNPGNTLFAMDSIGKIQKKVDLGIAIADWEAISQDSTYFYIGDFGNNVSGSRRDLRIFRLSKVSVAADKPIIDTISFSYSNQSIKSKEKANETNFDCEAFVVTADSIFLFTKQWKNKKTTVYALPKLPGRHVADFKAVLDVNGLVTDAVYVESQQVLLLCGYSKRLQPFLYLLYDFQRQDFFSGNKRKVRLKLPFHQVEGIAHATGLDFYLTNEKFKLKPFVNTAPKLHLVSLEALLKNLRPIQPD